MGGYDDSLSDLKKAEYFLYFTGIYGTEDPLSKFSKRKLELSLATTIMIGSSCILSSLMPSTFAGLSAIYLTNKIFESLGINSSVKSIIELSNTKGMSHSFLKESTYIPIPQIGIDTSAMRKRALEIKKESEYNNITRNCSWAVLECIKARLPDEVVEKLPSTGLYTTPTDVENIIAFLIENEYVISGEVDDDGLAWFDARTDID